MSKLLKLKEWLTIPEAAKHLSTVLGEEVREADVLRLGLDGHLKLSVYFVNHAWARCGKVVGIEEVEWWDLEDSEVTPAILRGITNDPKAEPQRAMKSLAIGDNRFLNRDNKVTTIQGVWGLPMIGGESLDIEHRYQQLTGGPKVTLVTLDGAFVEGHDGIMCQLQESYDDNEFQAGSKAQLEKLKQHIAINNIGTEEAERLLSRHKEERQKFLEEALSNPSAENYYPAGGLPEDAVLVVRTRTLAELEKRIGNDQTLKPIRERERTTLLTIIAALADAAKIDISKADKAGAAIAKLTEKLGAPVDHQTIANKLKLISDALDKRKK